MINIPRALALLAALPLLGAAPTEHWPLAPKAPKDAPSVLLILLDDTGFADTSSFGGLAQTPALDALADEGLIYNNFNVTAMCSPTRAALLSGHNHHATGFAAITEYAAAHPGYDSYWKKNTAPVAEVLRQSGYNTAAIGKWHNTPEWEISPAGPFDRWPTGLGFEYFYGFMGAEDNQWEPDRLYENTTHIEAPYTPEQGYHLTKDLADRALGWLGQHRSMADQKPFFLYVATGGTHTPHHAPSDWIARYHGKFDAGWDELRAQVFARQKALGIIPPSAVLTPRPAQIPAQIPAWASLSADERRLYARQMEVYAAYLAYTDHHLGRIINAARAADPNTLILYIAGDNGALGTPLPGYGGEASVSENLTRLREFGGPDVPYNQSQGGWGWMGNTPFQYWKTVASHFGGLRAPMVISWPGHLPRNRALRPQFTHVTDIVPTLYDLIGLAPPKAVNGTPQRPLPGASLRPTFASPSAPSPHPTQYFELLTNRAIYHEGWMASALSARYAPGKTQDEWELYNITQDFTQSRNLASQYPEKLAELKALFDREAKANLVEPLGGANFRSATKPFPFNGRNRFDFYSGASHIPYAQLPKLNRSFTLEADVEIDQPAASGVLASFGFKGKGFIWYLDQGRLTYENSIGTRAQTVTTAAPLPPGRHRLEARFTCTSCTTPASAFQTISGTLTLAVDGTPVTTQPLPRVNLTNAGEGFALHIAQTGGSHISTAVKAPAPLQGQLHRLTITLN
ncbi:MAG: arylsulfatase [Polymorphobacter sp.]|uniref:arylsulfatase n=1 Tax=Polymorphobacter sp. TaxID=1909290 RepID=UPI003A8C0F26